MKKTVMVCAAAALAGGAVLAAADNAKAATCAGLSNVVTIAGSSASKPIWVALAATLQNNNPPINIIYQGPSSCVGLGDVTSGSADTSSALYIDPVAGATACESGFVAAKTDIGVSDVFPQSCSSLQWPASGFAEFQGPVQVMLMAVPYQSTANAINWDAAYTVFGWGGANPMYQVMPWTDYQQIFIRAPTSGTETMIGSAIGLAPSKWLSQTPDAGAGQEQSGSGAVLSALQAAGAGTNPNAAIGILAADFGDTYRGAPGTNDAGAKTGGLKILAYQAKDQSCGYLPDSDATHFDKINVRQGRYDIWGPIHMVAAVDASGSPSNANVKTVIDLITASGITDMQNQTVIKADAKAHVIPQCAMQVKRTSEVSPVVGGGEMSYMPPQGCGCYYETLVNGGSPYSKYCKSCTSDSDCSSPNPKCHFGYCEAQ